MLLGSAALGGQVSKKTNNEFLRPVSSHVPQVTGLPLPFPGPQQRF